MLNQVNIIRLTKLYHPPMQGIEFLKECSHSKIILQGLNNWIKGLQNGQELHKD